MKHTRFTVTTSLAALTVFAVATALAQTEAPAPKPHPMIVGGQPVRDIADAHWQVALVDGNDNSRFQFCGGSLIAPNWVLTAAHCVDNSLVQKDPKRLDVIAGTLTYKTGGVRTDVDKIIVHPNWGATGVQLDFDATLLRLKTPITAVAPIKLMTPTGNLPVGPNVRVTGWGAISEGGPVSDKLLFVDVPVVSTAECNKPESYDGRITDQMFCAGFRAGGFDSCQGDSGGPVVSGLSGTRELAGIVSWGFGCARELLYGVYTRVTTVSQWATETMERESN
jgi:secreted trypsin-like serine protease